MAQGDAATKKLTPMEYLAQYSSGASASFQELRKAVVNSGPLDANTCELIVLAGFATGRIESGFKTHAKRALDDGVPVEALRQAVLVTLAATTTFNQALEALHWIDDVVGAA